MEEKFDGMFMTIVNDSKGIEGFLSNFFSFMRRKTDFYSTPDKGKEYVLRYFEEQNQIYKDNKRKEEQKAKAKEEQKRKEEQKKKEEEAKKNAKVVEITDEEAEQIIKNQNKPEPPKPVEKKPEASEETKEEAKEEGKDDDDKGLIPINNGGITERYIWTQSLREVTMNIFIPDNVPSRNIKVNVTVSNLQINVSGKPHVEGEFYDKIKPDDHVWTIDKVDGRRCIVLTFDKFEGQSWWKSALKGDPEINTKKVEPENSQLSDLDAETRPVVEKMMIDQRRKAAGLPSLEEEKNKDLLKGFMEKHPEMDFSKAKISGPGQNSFGGFNMN
jgi:N-terminal conserved domain of Nudc./CS domain